MNTPQTAAGSGLTRQMSLLGLVATGICSMIGASVYVVPFMIQRSVPGIGPYVIPAFVLAAVPALLAAFAYAVLASAMPRAGGSYVYASRGLSPYLGFVASFSQWFGLTIAIGVVSYVIVPFLRDIARALELTLLADSLDVGIVRLSASLIILWFFVWVNIRGIKIYERTVIPLMLFMFALGIIVISVGLSADHAAFQEALQRKTGQLIPVSDSHFDLFVFGSAAAILFSSFIGFDSIAQAGGEARHPHRNLPWAIGIAVVGVGSYYLLFTGAVYHAVPWPYIAQEASKADVTASGLLSVLLSPGWTVAIVLGAAIALTNDLPAMLLSVSRLMFAWAEDGIFPQQVAAVHPKNKTPTTALLISGAMASTGILGCHFAGDFFLGIDILVTSMLVNFLLMCLTVLTLPNRNPTLASAIHVFTNRNAQQGLAWSGILFLTAFLVIHIANDLTSPVGQWYFHSTPVWVLVMLLSSGFYFVGRKRLKDRGIDDQELFSKLPPE